MSTEWADGKPDQYVADTHYDVRLDSGRVRHVIGTARHGPRFQDCTHPQEDTRLDQGAVVAWRER